MAVPADADIRVHQSRPGRLLLTLPPMLSGDRRDPDILPNDPALRPMAEAMLRAAREPAFREDLRAAPVATLRGQGVVLAPGMMVDVIDAEPGRIDIIIPDLAPPGPGALAGRMIGASALLTMGGMVAFGIQRHGRPG
ncbi:hypothetical protein ACFQ4K_20475 [Tistrella bauzanensis]